MVLLVCIKSASVMSLPARTIKKTPLNCSLFFCFISGLATLIPHARFINYAMTAIIN